MHHERPYPLFEWLTAFAMLGIAFCIWYTPRTIEIGAFRYIIDLGIGPLTAFFMFTIGGFLRGAALIANGRWKYGGICRATGAGAGAVLWFYMTVALWLLTRETGTLSVGIPVYMALTAGEVVSCYRVAFDGLKHPAGNSHAGLQQPR